jgi:predicted anti-sigma-YlaC factor YlaD
MDCNKFKNKIIQYAEGTLPDEEKMDFELHLNECSECAVLFNRVSETYSAVDLKKEIEPKAFFAESVLGKIADAGNNEANEELLFTAFFRKLAITGVAFIFALLIFFYVSEGTLSFNFLSDDDSNIEDNSAEMIFENFN